MICNNCGTQFEDGSAFCPNCGTAATQPVNDYAQQAVPVQPVYGYAQQPVQPVQPVYQAAVSGNPEEAKSCMITGIIAAALSCTFIASFMGIVFGIIGLNKTKAYTEKYGQYTAKIRVGKYCSIGGIAFGGFMTLYAIIYLIAIIGMIANR